MQRGQMENHHKEYDEKHKLMLLNGFVQMKRQLFDTEQILVDKELRLQTVEMELEELKSTQQETKQDLYEKTVKLIETEERLYQSEQLHNEMRQQVKDVSKNFVSTLELLSGVLKENIKFEKGFEKNLAALKKNDVWQSDIKHTVQLFDARLEFHKVRSLKETFCYNAGFKRLCNSMEFDKEYFSGNDHYMKIKMDKDWIRHECTIRIVDKPILQENFQEIRELLEIRNPLHLTVHRSDSVLISVDHLNVSIAINLKGRFNIYIVNPINNHEAEIERNFNDLPSFVCDDGYILIRMNNFSNPLLNSYLSIGLESYFRSLGP